MQDAADLVHGQPLEGSGSRDRRSNPLPLHRSELDVLDPMAFDCGGIDGRESALGSAIAGLGISSAGHSVQPQPLGGAPPSDPDRSATEWARAVSKLEAEGFLSCRI